MNAMVPYSLKTRQNPEYDSPRKHPSHDIYFLDISDLNKRGCKSHSKPRQMGSKACYLDYPIPRAHTLRSTIRVNPEETRKVVRQGTVVVLIVVKACILALGANHFLIKQSYAHQIQMET